MSDVKLKICGVTSVAEARELSNLSVDFIGLNFVPTSSRCISVDTAQLIIRELEDSAVQTVAVFQDQPLTYVHQCLEELHTTYVQLHGKETAEYIQKVRLPVIKAISVKPSQTVDELEHYIRNCPADYFLLDRSRQGQGKRVSLQLAKQLNSFFPGRIFLSGGLSPENIINTLYQVQPYAIDIASGVSTNHKLDANKVRKCLEITQQAS